MIINHNISALNTYGRLVRNTTDNEKSLEKLSSGLRINRAGDDAAGLSISEKMKAQIRGLDQASRNSQDGISLIQTAEGALNETNSILQRMRELAVQSANSTNTDTDRQAMQNEISQLRDEVDRIGNTTEFNSQQLLNGDLVSSGNAVSGGNTTKGAQILQETNAQMTAAGGNFGSGDYSAIDVTQNETIMIDNVTLTINWNSELTSAEQTTIAASYGTNAMTTSQQTMIEKALQRAINDTIDQYNSQNSANVDHVTIYESPTGSLIMQSGKSGEDSNIVFASGNGATFVLADYFVGASGGANFSGDDLIQKNIIGSNIEFQINGVNLQANFNGSITANDSATTIAGSLQLSMQAAATAYNQAASLISGDVGWIDVSKIFINAANGRFTVSTASTDTAITFTEKEGFTTITDLGLTSAQTSSAGNGGLTFQIGPNEGQTLTFGISDMRSTALGIAGLDISTESGATKAISTLDSAILDVTTGRSQLGAIQNRLEHTVNNLSTSYENLSAAESRIADVDMAKEMMEYTKTNILNQAAQAMLAQANQQPQSVLQLLK